MTDYAFVLDANGNQLAPTKEQKAWFLIRKKRATLVSKYPMVSSCLWQEGVDFYNGLLGDTAIQVLTAL